MNEESFIVINERLKIPLSELRFQFSTSSGPGGQHVNKAETKVTLLFDVAHSPSLDEAIRGQLLQKLAARLNKEGVLQIQAQESRSQWQNRATAVARFQNVLADALKAPRRRRQTQPSRAAREARLLAKKRRSELKQERSRKWEYDK
jgi:ribosome-associated protein